MRGRRRILRFLALSIVLASVAWTVWVGVRIWTTPVRYQVAGATVPGEFIGDDGRRYVNRPFDEVSSAGPVPLLVPIGVTAAALAGAVAGSTPFLGFSAFLLFVLSFIGGFSIGGAYMPAALALGLATVLQYLQRRLPSQADG